MDAKKCLFLWAQLEACVISGLPQVSVLGPLWFTVSIWAIFHFSWLLLRATHITMRHSTLTFSLQFVLKNVEDKMFFNERKEMAGSWRHHVKCQSFHIISLTVLPSMNLKSKWKVPSEKNYREFILVKRCTGLCTCILRRTRHNWQMRPT